MRRRMGMLFQNGALLTDLDVYENVAFPLREHTRLPERLVRHLVLTKLQAVGLRGAARLMPAELSGGMARRVALARAIVMDPELLIYDEPFVGLDPISLGVVLRLIRRLNDTLGVTEHRRVARRARDHRGRGPLPPAVRRARRRERAAGRGCGQRRTRTCASSCTGCRTARCRSTTRRRTTPNSARQVT